MSSLIASDPQSAFREISPEGRRDLESRVGTDALDDLHARRRALLKQYAPLRALYGPGGIWDARRKALVEAYKVDARTILTTPDGKKPTDGTVEAMAYSDIRYKTFLDKSEGELITFVTLDVEWREIDERIYSRSLEVSAFSAEARLQR